VTRMCPYCRRPFHGCVCGEVNGDFDPYENYEPINWLGRLIYGLAFLFFLSIGGCVAWII